MLSVKHWLIYRLTHVSPVQLQSSCKSTVTVNTVTWGRAGTRSCTLTHDPTRPRWIEIYPLCSNKIWDPLLISVIMEVSEFKFSTQFGFTKYATKTTQNWQGAGWAWEARKFWDPYLPVFLQSLNLTTSTLIHKLGLSSNLLKTTFMAKISCVWTRGAPPKFGGAYFATNEAIATSYLRFELYI